MDSGLLAQIQKGKALKNTKKVLKGLKAKKKYYIRVRTFKSVGGVKYFSDWSEAKAIRTK